MKIFGATFTVAFFFLIFLLSAELKRAPAGLEKSLADFNYRRSYISLDDSFNYSGLTHRPGEDGRYVQRLLGKLIQKADVLARDWKDSDPEIYHTFLLAALTVPMHESTLMHFTRRDPREFCYFSNDLLVDIERGIENIRKEPEGATKKTRLSNANYLKENIPRFYQALSHGTDLFKSCKELFHHSEVQQILFSNDYADIGIMMLNSTSHRNFFKVGRIFHVDQVIEYGLNYLFDGFEAIATNSENYSCLKNLEGNPEFYDRLMRAAWGGKYNSGNLGETCRFMNPNHKFSKNDVGFLRNFNKYFNQESVYHQYLPINSEERNFFLDLIQYFRTPEKMGNILEVILKRDYSSSLDVEKNIEPLQEEILEQIIIENDQKLEEGVADLADNIRDEVSLEVGMDMTDESGGHEKLPVEDPPQMQLQNPKPVEDIIEIREIVYGHFDGININLRSFAEVSPASLCFNTKVLAHPQIQFKVLGETGDFFEISNVFDRGECDQNSLFVHRDFVKKTFEKVENPKLAKFRLNSWVSVRDRKGLRESLVLYSQGPLEYTLIDEYTFNGGHVWHSYLDSSGQQVWFYAGVTGDLKVEAIP